MDSTPSNESSAAPIYEDTRILHISPIQIVMHLNTKPKEEITLTYDMISVPKPITEKESEPTPPGNSSPPPPQNGGDSVDAAPVPTTTETSSSGGSYKYPFFTNSVKYPKSMLINKGYAYCLEFFFNRDVFERTLLTNMKDYVNQDDIVADPLMDIEEANPEEILTLDTGNVGKSMDDLKALLMDNTEYNVMTMLRCLFPISSDFGKLVSTTYRQYILGEFNMNIFSFNFLNPFGTKNEEEISLKIHGKEDLITDVIWLNDVINHPEYREFVKTYNVKMRERLGFAKSVDVMVNDKLRDFALKLGSFYAAPVATAVPTPPATAASPVAASPPAVAATAVEDLYHKLLADLSGNMVNGAPTSLDKRQNAKNETIQRMMNRLQTDVFLDRLKEVTRQVETNPTTKKQTVRKFKQMDMYKQFLSNAEEVANTITRIYNDLFLYNSGKEFVINLSADVSRPFGLLYMSAIYVKTARLVKLFIQGIVPQFDLNEKNHDGSDKSKEEVDIIRELKENNTQYVELSKQINESLKNIYPPARESSNFDLQQLLKSMKEQQTTSLGVANGGSPSTIAEADFFKDIYAKYMRGTVRHPFSMHYMYTGVNTITAKTGDSGKNIMKEIHVMVDVIDKKKYIRKKNKCAVSDDILSNEFLYLLNFDNLYQVNPYRLYEGFEELMNHEVTPPSVEPATPPPPPPNQVEPSAKMGGGYIKKNVSIRKRKRISNTTKRAKN